MTNIRLLRTIIIIVISTALASCKNPNVEAYKRIVNAADKIEIVYQNGKTIVLVGQQLMTFKPLLVRSIKAEAQRKFNYHMRINLYQHSKRLGFLLITYDSQPFVNFYSDDSNFGFRMNYGLGMSLGNM